ncbi:MAG: lamin tail domain-containing protein, partial [Planctomycetales bacterium]|nr:lamin tail domain-containing protein [Planctomycetales bacterium]
MLQRTRNARNRTVRQRLQLESLESRCLLVAGPFISEFVADNNDSLLDGDGDSPDWIEIRNRDSSPIDLEGWFLTDDANQLDKWRFPSAPIEADGYFVVFASGKDTAGPAGEIHTNFSLDRDGEFLALVEPDGATIAHAFAPFPAQDEDISYGVFENVLEAPLLETGDSARFLAPSDNALGAAW